MITDVIFASDQDRDRVSHVHWRSLNVWERLLAERGLALHFYVPMYVFLYPGISGLAWVRGLANRVHGRLTSRLAHRKGIGPLYLRTLDMLDRLSTRLGGTSMYMVFSRRVQWIKYNLLYLSSGYWR